MPDNISLPKTETLIRPATSSRYTITGSGRQAKGLVRIGHGFVVFWAAIAALATVSQAVPTNFLERSMQSRFFNWRGAVDPPQNVVILAIDDNSLDPSLPPIPQPQGAPIKLTYPIRRSIYAEVINRLMQAGARTVALDVLFLGSSNYSEDDARLLKTLEQHSKRLVLAASYGDSQLRQGSLDQFQRPYSSDLPSPPTIGTINFWPEPSSLWNVPQGPEGVVHRLGSQFPILAAKQNPTQATYFSNIAAEVPSFAEATLKTTGVSYPAPRGENVFFYGEKGTFPSFPIWEVLDTNEWNRHQKNGDFQDKIVLIGATAGSLKDNILTPFGAMPGVEIHANAIATLQENRSIAEVFPSPWARGSFVLMLVVTAGFLQGSVLSLLGSKRLRPQLQRSLIRFILAAGLVRFLIAAAIAVTWGGIGYFTFIYGRAIVPVAIPMAGILLSGATYLVTATVGEYLSKLQLLKILAQFPRSEVVQRILSEYVEFQELLQEPDEAFKGKILVNRYQVTEVLGAGGFGKTYIAQDHLRPGHPLCVVKQLKPVSDNPNLMQLAHKLFRREANTLEALGKHDRIPQLLASFEEEGEFYLVQEYILGRPLEKELSLGRRLSEAWVVSVLQEILQILEFVHSQDVIHRDIKPSNIIRRESDKKLVLIDFGAVKITDQVDDSALTVGIGTKGYMPNEQSGGKPRPNSDIFAVGIIGIQALTRLSPRQLREKEDPQTGSIPWHDFARVSPTLSVNPALAKILDRMTHYDYQQRYQTVREVLDDLQPLAQLLGSPSLEIEESASELPSNDIPSDYAEGETRRWSEAIEPDFTSEEENE
jgi:CHASE2 domain-containing sensor protein